MTEEILNDGELDEIDGQSILSEVKVVNHQAEATLQRVRNEIIEAQSVGEVEQTRLNGVITRELDVIEKVEATMLTELDK